MRPFKIHATTLALSGLMMLSSAAAQTPDNDSVAAEELRTQLDVAREEVAEAAQRLARLQRELIEAEGGLQSWAWKHAEGGLEDIEIDLELDDIGSRLQRMTIAAFPPRLGVLLDSTESGDSNRIVGVTPGSGAEEAGLREGDLLLEVGGQDVRVDTGMRVREALATVAPGESVDVLLARDDGAIELLVPVKVSSALNNIRMLSGRMGPDIERIEREIIRRHPDAPKPPTAPMPPRPPHLAGLGHDTDLISNHEGLATYFGTGEGVLVLRIAADNPLQLESGDVILSIDGDGIQRPVDLGRALLNRDPGDDITVEVMRQGNLTQLFGTIPDRSTHGLGGRVGQAPNPMRSIL